MESRCEHGYNHHGGPHACDSCMDGLCPYWAFDGRPEDYPEGWIGPQDIFVRYNPNKHLPGWEITPHRRSGGWV